MENSTNKKQTAIQWAFEKLYQKGLLKDADGNEPINLMNQALQMEREQIEAMRIYAKEQNAELEEVLKGFVNSFYRSDLKFGSQLMVYDKALALIKKTTNE